MRNLKAVSRVTLGEQVALQIAQMISEGRWRAGAKLPPEAELCRALNIGRSTLREALKSLAFTGMVRMRAGDGTYVIGSTPGTLDRILARGLLTTKQDLADVSEMRMILETELAALAAQRARANDIERLRVLVLELRQSLHGEGRPYVDLDLDFHIAIAACAKNRVLRQLVVGVREVLAEWIMKSQELPGLRENAQEQHERILQSIVDHDAEGARREMRAHLETFQRAYSLLSKLSESETETNASVAAL
jgi:GntR family transcriptional repressor for pyruvate dehydrogenase complex